MPDRGSGQCPAARSAGRGEEALMSGSNPVNARSQARDTALVATAGGLYGLMVTVTVPLTMLPCASCTCMGKLNVPAWAGVPVRTLL